MEILLSQATEQDFAFLLSLRKATMTPHLEKAGLFLTEQQHEERVAEAFEHSHIITIDNQRVGLLKYQDDGEQVNIMQLQILPECQGKGYGKGVLQHVIAAANNKPVMLTVLKDNPAYNLYLRMGFISVGEDKYEYHMTFTH